MTKKYSVITSTSRHLDRAGGLASNARLQPILWEVTSSIHAWWSAMAILVGVPRREVRSLIILATWEIWKECNARIFDRREKHRFGVWLVQSS